MSFLKAKKCFEANVKSLDVRKDRAAYNLNQGLKLLTEAMAEADRQQANDLHQIKQALNALAR